MPPLSTVAVKVTAVCATALAGVIATVAVAAAIAAMTKVWKELRLPLVVVTVYVPAVVNTNELRCKLATPLTAFPVTAWE